ncbi:hypothetical protein HanRHA438_Chr08g0337641 [Helianthus annuus]|nr:hypothetical protein HanIR_Chr08g0352761 [Helianthus annuus]KAJ0896709.1 hypothetical protein HanRHA438_Chr08g0337641 [Helianthus annuus]
MCINHFLQMLWLSYEGLLRRFWCVLPGLEEEDIPQLYPKWPNLAM